MEHLHEFETMDLDTIQRQGSHPVEVVRLARKARDRLAEIKQDDVDYLRSFRITAKKRVWCIPDRNIMRVLWWDPNHTVCPSLKRHT